MKNLALSILSLILLVTAAAHPAEAAPRKSKADVLRSDRSRDAFATMIPSTAQIQPDPMVSEIDRMRNGALSPPAGR